MARRYSDISRGPLLAQAYQRRQQYLARDIEARNAGSQIGTRASSPAVTIVVKAFGLDFAANNNSFRARTNVDNRTQLRAAIGTHAIEPVEDAVFQTNGNFVPAKIKLFVKTTSAPATSRVTGLRYLKANGRSYSHPFGAATATDREFNVYNSIASDLRNDNNKNRVSYSPEKITNEL